MKEMEKDFQNVWNTEAGEILRLCRTVDWDRAEKLADLFLETKKQGKKIFFAGVGTSGAAAKKAAHSFSCVEFPALFLSPGDAVHGGLGAVDKGDTVVLISKGGGTFEIVRIIESLKTQGAAIVGVTENPESELGKKADLTVKIKIEKEPDLFNMLATASTMAVIAFFDAMAIYLMKKSGYTREQFAVIHTGGAVGDRLIKGRE